MRSSYTVVTALLSGINESERARKRKCSQVMFSSDLAENICTERFHIILKITIYFDAMQLMHL